MMADDEAERRSRNYQEELPDDNSRAWQLLESYSGIPADQVESAPPRHSMLAPPSESGPREKAYAIFPYGCIGRWRFLDFYITTLPEYPGLIKRVQDGDTLLDAGCCFGYVPRQLAFDGAPAERLIGADLRQEFLDLGYELFGDRGKFAGRFVAGNMLTEPPDAALAALDGTVDIIHAASFFHLFSWADQVRLGERLLRFFKPAAKNAVVLGRQRGNAHPLDRAEHDRQGLVRYLHNPQTLQELWDEIGQRTGTKWKVAAHITEDTWGADNKRVGIIFNVQKVG